MPRGGCAHWHQPRCAPTAARQPSHPRSRRSPRPARRSTLPATAQGSLSPLSGHGWVSHCPLHHPGAKLLPRPMPATRRLRPAPGEPRGQPPAPPAPSLGALRSAPADRPATGARPQRLRADPAPRAPAAPALATAPAARPRHGHPRPPPASSGHPATPAPALRHAPGGTLLHLASSHATSTGLARLCHRHTGEDTSCARLSGSLRCLQPAPCRQAQARPRRTGGAQGAAAPSPARSQRGDAPSWVGTGDPPARAALPHRRAVGDAAPRPGPAAAGGGSQGTTSGGRGHPDISGRGPAGARGAGGAAVPAAVPGRGAGDQPANHPRAAGRHPGPGEEGGPAGRVSRGPGTLMFRGADGKRGGPCQRFGCCCPWVPGATVHACGTVSRCNASPARACPACARGSRPVPGEGAGVQARGQWELGPCLAPVQLLCPCWL